MIQIEWLPEAFDDLKRLYDFLKPLDSDVAKKVIQKIISESELLQEFPEKGKPWNDDILFRELIVKFGMRGYIIRYRFKDDTVYIVRIWHMLEHR